VAIAGLLISSGALADRFGRRRVFRLGLALFGVASVACALAPSVGVLTAARVAQGVGGSMLSPVALAIVVNVITDPKERAQAIGVYGSVFGLSMAVGPLTGGALIEGFGWRAVFWLNLPVVAAVLLLTVPFVPESRAPRPRRLDAPGSCCSSYSSRGLWLCSSRGRASAGDRPRHSPVTRSSPWRRSGSRESRRGAPIR
jgi:MFS family permease